MNDELTDVQIKPSSAGGNKRSAQSKGAAQKGKGKGKKDAAEGLEVQRASPRFPCVNGHTTNDEKKNCSICELQMKQPQRFDSKKIINTSLFMQDPNKPDQTTGFMEFIQYLLPPSPDLEGCEVQFPDSVFFQFGKPAFIAMTDKEGKLKQQNHPRYLGLSNMRQSLSEVVKLRKQEVKGPLSAPEQQNGDNVQANTSPKSKSKKNAAGQSGPGHGGHGGATAADPTATAGGAAADSRKSPWYADTALVRYNHRDEVRVLRDQDFANEFQRRPNAEYWTEVEVIQTCIKAQTGCGEPIIWKFLAKIDEQNPDAEIRYDYYKDMPKDEELLLVGNDTAYVEKQCLKMCYYIQKVCGHEILQMKAEFFKDANQQIWFFYARNIHARKSKGSNATSSSDAKKQAKKLQQSKEAVRKQMINELEQYESQQKNQRSGAVQQMLNMMNQYYSTLKSEVGIQDQAGLDDEDYDLDNILKTLKPNTTAVNFREFLKREDNCTKTQAWRGISRKIHADDEKKLRKLQEEEDGPFNPGQMKVTALYDAFQNNYRTQKTPMIDEPGQLKLLDKIVQNQQEMRPQEMGTRGPTGDNLRHNYDTRDSAQVKAELIRRNLLSRKDLMQLYRPPLKKSQLPQNNPFIARNLVTRDINSAIVRVSSVGPGGKINNTNSLVPFAQNSNLRNANITLNLINQTQKQDQNAYRTDGMLNHVRTKGSMASNLNLNGTMTRSFKDISVNQRKNNKLYQSHGQRPTTTGNQVTRTVQAQGSIFNYAAQGSVQTNHDSLVQINQGPNSQMNIVGVPGAVGHANYQQMVLMGKSASNNPQVYMNSSKTPMYGNSNSLNAGINFASSAYTNSQTALTGQTLHQSKGAIVRGNTAKRIGQQTRQEGMKKPQKSLIQTRALQGNQSSLAQGASLAISGQNKHLNNYM